MTGEAAEDVQFVDTEAASLTVCRKAVELTPDNTEDWNRLGQLLYCRGEFV